MGIVRPAHSLDSSCWPSKHHDDWLAGRAFDAEGAHCCPQKGRGVCGAPVPEGYRMRLILQRQVGEATNDKVT